LFLGNDVEKKRVWRSRMDLGERRDLIPVLLAGLERIAQRCGSMTSSNITLSFVHSIIDYVFDPLMNKAPLARFPR